MSERDSIEHDSLDDAQGKALKYAPADKMMREDDKVLTKRGQVRLIREQLRRERTKPWLDVDNPAIWDGEI